MLRAEDDSGTESEDFSGSVASVHDDDEKEPDRKRSGAAKIQEPASANKRRRRQESNSADEESAITADPSSSGLIEAAGYNRNEGIDPRTILLDPLRGSSAPSVVGGAANSNLLAEAGLHRSLGSNTTGYRGGFAGRNNDALSQAIALQQEIDRRRVAMQLTALQQQQPPSPSSSLFNNPYVLSQDALLSQQLWGSAMGAQAGVRSDNMLGGALRLVPSIVGNNPYSLPNSVAGLVPPMSSMGAAMNEGGLPVSLPANQNFPFQPGASLYQGIDPATALALQRLQQQQEAASNVANSGLSTDFLSQHLRDSASASLLPPASLGRFDLSSSANPTAFPLQQQQLPSQILQQQQSMRIPELSATNVAAAVTAASPSALAESSHAMPSCAPLAPDGFPFHLPAILARPDDSNRLSSHQLLLRYQIEVFQATDDDINTHIRGRNKPIVLSQVGMRCRHCASLPVAQRKKGSTYFPATLMGIYQAAQNMSTTHMQCGLCHRMPEEIKTLFARLLPTKMSSTGAGRQAWAIAGQKLGLVDTKEGIYFVRQVPPGVEVVPSNFRTTTTTGAGAARKSPPPA